MVLSSSTYFSLALILACFSRESHCWVNLPPPGWSSPANSRSIPPLQSTNAKGVDSFSLTGFENHQEEGEKMAQSIAAWLDAEWMPQEVHRRMAESAKRSYIQCRESGEDDLMQIMTTIADDLTENWKDYDADAFINCWDIANYVSDYLVQVSGSESCECSSKIF